MSKHEKEMFDIINRNHACASIVDRIEKNLDCDMMARKLNVISAGRRNKPTTTNN